MGSNDRLPRMPGCSAEELPASSLSVRLRGRIALRARPEVGDPAVDIRVPELFASPSDQLGLVATPERS